MNGNKLNNVRLETSKNFRNEKGNILTFEVRMMCKCITNYTVTVTDYMENCAQNSSQE
jgi:hypothetical protein